MQFTEFKTLKTKELQLGKVYKLIGVFGKLGLGTFFIQTIKDKNVLVYKDFVGRMTIGAYSCSFSKFVEI